MEELVVKAKNGDKEAYTKLIREVQTELYKIAKTKISDEEEIKDIVQETVINAYLNIKKLRNNEHFRTWIVKILINECNRFYKEKKRNNEINDKCIEVSKLKNGVTNIENELDFDSIIQELNDVEKKIFRLYYNEGYSIKEISNKLNINSNTIKTKLSRGKIKIKSKYQTLITMMVIVFVATTGVVFGKDIINYLKSIFNLSNVGQNNDGIVNAIEEKEIVQNIDMDYIQLNEDYRIKIEHMLLDEINLYFVFNLESSKDFGNYNRFSIADLEIEDEQGNKIWNQGDLNNQYIVKLVGYKPIDNTSNSIRELIYMISDEYPESKKFIIKFSKIMLYNTESEVKEREEIYTEQKSIEIEIKEELINKNTIEYDVINNGDNTILVKKAIITDTGFYAIVSLKNEEIECKLKDKGNKEFICHRILLDMYDENNQNYYLIQADITDKKAESLFLVYKDKEIILKKNKSD